MADFFIEFTTLGAGEPQDNVAEAVVAGLVGTTAALTPSGSSLAGSRPTVPSGGGKSVVAMLTNTGSAARKASWGDDPNATSDDQFVVIPPGLFRGVAIPSGAKIDVVNA